MPSYWFVAAGKRKRQLKYIKTMRELDLATHLRKWCELRLLPCGNGCGARLTAAAMPEHKDNTCPKRRVPCVNAHLGCLKVMPFDELKWHVQNKCRKGLVIYVPLTAACSLHLKHVVTVSGDGCFGKRFTEQHHDIVRTQVLLVTHLKYGLSIRLCSVDIHHDHMHPR